MSSTRPAPDITAPKGETSAAENQLNTNMLDTVSQTFLDLDTLESTSDLENLDIDSLKYIQGLIVRKITLSTYMQADAEARKYASLTQMFKFKWDTISKSMARFTSRPGNDTTKQTKNTPKLRNVSVSDSSTSPSKNAAPNGK